MKSQVLLHAFVAMPFGVKPSQSGQAIDFNRVYEDLIKPGLEAAGLAPFRADEELSAGDIRSDMFQELLLADLVVADLTIDNPNVWYELGVRHALRSRGVLLIQGPRERPVFDVGPDRKLHYSLKDGLPDPAKLDAERAALAAMAKATLSSWEGRRISPVYSLLPNLEEPDWKSLKVGEALSFWRRQEEWAVRIDQARRRRRPGDILVLAEEAPVSALRGEAYFKAGDALRRLEQFDFALEQFNACLDVLPKHTQAKQMKGVCLQRLGLLDDARRVYRSIIEDDPRDAESWALLGRVDKDAWIAAWRDRPGATPQTWVSDAAYEEALLSNAINSYLSGFRANANHFYSGINALTLMHLAQHLDCSIEADNQIELLAGALRWAIAIENRRLKAGGSPSECYWSAATEGDLEVLVGTPESVRRAYKRAITLLESDWFALNSTLSSLRVLLQLGLYPDRVAAGIETFDRALARLSPPGSGWRPQQVVVFSGHILDAPDRATPRFPESIEADVTIEIARELDALGLGPDDLALTQGAAGADLIFAEAALHRGARLQLMQPFDEPEFLARSVKIRGPRWLRRYEQVRARLVAAPSGDPLTGQSPSAASPLIASAERDLGEAEDRGHRLGPSVDPFERCNLWLLQTALAYGIDKLRLIVVWNGEGGDGPGGTADMVRQAKARTGRVTWIDTRELLARRQTMQDPACDG